MRDQEEMRGCFVAGNRPKSAEEVFELQSEFDNWVTEIREDAYRRSSLAIALSLTAAKHPWRAVTKDELLDETIASAMKASWWKMASASGQMEVIRKIENLRRRLMAKGGGSAGEWNYALVSELVLLERDASELRLDSMRTVEEL